MLISQGIKVTLAVASGEAMNLHARDLDVEHIFLALLKLEDFRNERLFFGLGEKEWQVALAEMEKLDLIWSNIHVSCNQVRRRLRAILQKENTEKEEFSGHRTDRCRMMFQRSEQRQLQRGKQILDLNAILEGCLNEKSLPLDTLFLEIGLERGIILRQLKTIFKEPQNIEVGAAVQPEVNADKPPDKSLDESPLSRYGRDLTFLARQGKLNPVIGRKEEMRQVARILNQKMRSNPILLGDPGVGKTAVVEGLAQRAASQKAPEAIANLHFVEITMAALVAGAIYRGQFEERLIEVIQKAREDRSLVLFIDEIHTLLGTGASKGQLDAANILKPALAGGEIRCIGATTNDEFRKYLETDAALTRRFQPVFIQQTSREETIEILNGLKPKLESHHHLVIPQNIIPRAVDLVTRFIQEGCFPDKAIMVLDECCARKRLISLSDGFNGGMPSEISLVDVAEVIARRTNSPLDLILSSDEERLLGLEQFLSRRVKGQEKAVNVVGRMVRTTRAGLKKSGSPQVAMFAGPTGTGKTELAKALTEFLYRDEKRLIRLDMSEFQAEHDVSKIIGSPPGYVGFGEEPYLIKTIRSYPNSVVLLDEIEKAHPRVLTIFLQIFDEGRMMDARGNLISFSGAFIILTSNLGTSPIKQHKKPIGFLELNESEEQINQGESKVKDAISAFLQPELLNRIQEVVVFQTLTRLAVEQILDKLVTELNQRISHKGLKVNLTQAMRDYLIEQGYSPEYGARHLARIFEKTIFDPLSRAMLERTIQEGQTVNVDIVNGVIKLVKKNEK